MKKSLLAMLLCALMLCPVLAVGALAEEPQTAPEGSYAITNVQYQNGDDCWNSAYQSFILLAGEGYQIAEDPNRSFSTGISFNRGVFIESDVKLTFWLKDTATGEVSGPFQTKETLHWDEGAPVCRVELSTGEVFSRWEENITFGIVCPEGTTFSVSGIYEEGSGVAAIRYYISDTPMSNNELYAVEMSTCAVGQAIPLNAGERNIIYILIQDNTGYGSWMCSDGIVCTSRSDPPQTGDPILLWAALSAASAAGIGLLRRRKGE